MKKYSPFFVPFLFLILLFTGGCRQEDNPAEQQDTGIVAGCTGCHAVDLDPHHQLSCSKCHRGVDGEKDRQTSHQGLVKQPAHPDNAEQFCQRCHQQETTMVGSNDHYTLSSHIYFVRNAFGLPKENVTLADIHASETPNSVQQLTNDLLRRRCLRCHVYSEGDDFPAAKRASGCGSCHLEYSGGTLVSHRFLKQPNDSNCLSCHYGNHVGFDYYGRFEHDLNEEYRTPYTTRADYFRPFGIEYHQLESDVHHRGGMVCIDCHDREQVMGNSSTGRACTSCHDREHLENNSSQAITQSDGEYRFTSMATGKSIVLPTMVHPAHLKYNSQVSCQGCHALWSFYDDETHLLRIDHDELDAFEKLTRDGNSEVNRILASHMEYDGEWFDPEMKDQLSNEMFPGIWLKGFKQRRWEQTRLVQDSNGLYQVARPLLDLHLSWIDAEGILQFDNIAIHPDKSPLLPYAPHTIGKAGPFFEQRLTILNDLEVPAPDQLTNESH